MARTAAGRRLTDAHREEQLKLFGEMVQAGLGLWSLLPLDDMDMRRQSWLDQTVRLVLDGREESAAAAADYYRRFRAVDAGVLSDVPTVDVRPDVGQVRATVDVAGPVRFKSLVGAGYPPERAFAAAGVAAVGRVARLAYDGGRETLLGLGMQDRESVGVIRVTGDQPCAFCAMLSSRGPVYKSVDTAAGGRWSDRDEGFKVHDACVCTYETVFSTDSEWPGRSREFRRMWDESTDEARQAGLIGTDQPGRDALNAFRRRLEGRPVVSDRVRRPANPQSRRARPIPPTAEQFRVIDASEVPRRLAEQQQWAEGIGWQTEVRGRRITGVREGQSIVWRLDEFGRWMTDEFQRN